MEIESPNNSVFLQVIINICLKDYYGICNFVVEAMLRAIYAFWQMYLCFLSNVFLLTIKCQYDYYQI